MNAKQLAKLIALVAITFGICFGLLVLSDGASTQVFEEMLSAFLVVATFLVTLSVAMFTYVDNISKDLVELRNEVPRDKLNNVIDQLSSLKREVVSNGGLIVALVILERTTKGIAVYQLAYYQDEMQAMISYIALSLRFSFFCVSIFAASMQLNGFIIASQYRDIIAKNRK
ncbi:hypothetical protein [Methylogaea oryzae]|uniref:hypothetical protein n=1 Tax=Methylogaea oryzae TaxID=1295382 RepID=UPI0012E0ECA5|nr:hypothetical protein [Methylogaea oryzae]